MGYYLLVLDILLLMAIAADLIGNLTFLRAYFTLGIPVYRTRLFCDVLHPPAGLERYLTDRMRSGLLPSLVFRRLSDSEIGFREKLFQWGFKVGYMPIMHGVVQFSQAEHSVVITGRLNWVLLVFIGLSLSTAWGAGAGLSFVVTYLGISSLFVGVCYALQAYRYKGVARVLSQRLRASIEAGARH